MTKVKRLTKREIECLKLIAQGFSSQEVANATFVSKRTVDFHLANAYDKLEARNRVQAIRTALGRNIFQDPTLVRVIA